MTLAEFLAWEERQELRYEFDGFVPVAMTGGTLRHGAIQANLVIALGTRLRGSPCRAFGEGIKIEADGSIRYPDAFVRCGGAIDDKTIADDPVVVFEILSPSSSRTDRIAKVREYGNTPSIQRYVILEQTSQAATVFTRQHGKWTAELVSEDAELDMPEIGISVPLADLYEGVSFPEHEADG